MSKEKDYEAFKELCEITALLNRNAQRNAVTVPADKLAELQRKAKLVDELEKENAQLKAKIADGIRVYVEHYEDEMFINETAVGKEMRNATLLLDEDWDK